ncbi:hypothetical protein HZA73_07240 [candidate division TA06 bacterium]|nr:hypothetical protein [candidate division TA06 bacterium]
MLKRYYVVLVITLIIISGCSKKNPVESSTNITVKVVTDGGIPVAGAWIEGGIDWDAYSVSTDNYGQAILPGSALGNTAGIYCTNYFPKSIDKIDTVQYYLQPTSQNLLELGPVLGSPVKFGAGQLATIDYWGWYRVYSHNTQSASLIYSQQLQDSSLCIKHIKLSNDTMWFSTHDRGIYAYSVATMASPQLLFHLDIPGHRNVFAIKDSILAIGSPWDPDSICFIVWHGDGTWHKIGGVQKYLVNEMAFVGSNLAVLGYQGLPDIIDASNPADPYLGYHGLVPNWEPGFIYGQYAVLIESFINFVNFTTQFQVIDASNATSPIVVGTFPSDGYPLGAVSSQYGYGWMGSHTYCVLSGSILSGYSAVATMAEPGNYPANTSVGGSHPYYIFGNKLWMMNAKKK